MNVFPGPGSTRFSAVVANPQVLKFGSVNVPEKVDAPPELARPDMVTLTGVAVVHELPTRLVVVPVAYALTIRMLKLAVAVMFKARRSRTPVTGLVGTILAVAWIKGRIPPP